MKGAAGISKFLCKGSFLAAAIFLVILSIFFFSARPRTLMAQAGGPSMLDPKLDVRTVVTGLVTPTTMAFLGDDDFLVLEKNTGKVQRVLRGIKRDPVLSLPVNFFSERGLLGIALHPDFEDNGFVYLYWTESSTGTVSGDPAAVPLLGNRVDRFKWNGSTLTFDRNLIKLRAFQADEGQPLRGNHDGGVIVFESEREREGEGENSNHRGRRDREGEEKSKLFIIMGDNGRRGNLQNVSFGTFRDGVHDDQFGGPEPDNAHLTGVILRLNDDGTTPEDNPFFEAGDRIGGEVGANIQKIFAYGVRNSFGLAVDPLSGNLWDEENGDDSFDEINIVPPGSNNGWVQIMGPVERIREYKAIETSPRFFGLQQIRWPPTLIADTQQEALRRLFVIRGSHYNDPQFSWKFATPPAAIGFVKGDALGKEFEGDLFVGAATPLTVGGHLFRFKLTEDRRALQFQDPRLRDRVADNLDKHDITESESLLIGRDFGIGTDIKTGPNGNLFVVSLTRGAVFEIFRRERD